MVQAGYRNTTPPGQINLPPKNDSRWLSIVVLTTHETSRKIFGLDMIKTPTQQGQKHPYQMREEQIKMTMDEEVSDREPSTVEEGMAALEQEQNLWKPGVRSGEVIH